MTTTPVSHGRAEDLASHDEPDKCKSCLKNALDGKEKPDLKDFYDAAELVIKNKNEPQSAIDLGIPVYGQDRRKFLFEVHQFSLECQMLLPSWRDCVGQSAKAPDIPDDDTKQRGFVGDFADLFAHIVGEIPNIEHLKEHGCLTEEAKKLCKAKYVNNVKLFTQNMKSLEEGKGAPDFQNQDGLFTGETLLHILIVRNEEAQSAVQDLLTCAQRDFVPKESIPQAAATNARSNQHPDPLECEVEQASEFMAMVTARTEGLFFQPPIIYRPEWRAGCGTILDVFGVEPKFDNPWSSCFFGDRPLAFAASVGNIPALNALVQTVQQEAIDLGRDAKQFLLDFLQLHDSFGNTALHMAVRYKNKKVIAWFVRVSEKLEDWSCFQRLNLDLHTPLTLAVFLGHLQLFREMVDQTGFRKTKWQYGRCHHAVTDLGQIDSWQSDMTIGKAEGGYKAVWLYPISLEKGLEEEDKTKSQVTQGEGSAVGGFRKRWCEAVGVRHGVKVERKWHTPKPKSALEIAVRHEVGDASQQDIFTSLIQQKWHVYGRTVYIVTALLPYIFFLACISLYILDRSTVLREALAAGKEKGDMVELGSARETAYELVFLLAFSIILCVRGWIHLRIDYTDLDTNNDRVISSREIESFFFKNMVSCFSFAVVVLMWAAWLCRASENDFEMNLLAVLGFLAWTHGATYLLPFKFFGKLIIAIHRMVAIDLVQFLAIYVFSLFGWSLALHALIQSVPEEVLADASCEQCNTSWGRLALRYLWASLGEVDMTQVMMNASSPWLAFGLHISFIIGSTVLLLNLLIALLSKTFADTNETGAERWWHEFAGTVLRYEFFVRKRIMPWLNKGRSRNGHWFMLQTRTGQPDNGRCLYHDQDFPFHFAVTGMATHDDDDKDDKNDKAGSNHPDPFAPLDSLMPAPSPSLASRSYHSTQQQQHQYQQQYQQQHQHQPARGQGRPPSPYAQGTVMYGPPSTGSTGYAAGPGMAVPVNSQHHVQVASQGLVPAVSAAPMDMSSYAGQA